MRGSAHVLDRTRLGVQRAALDRQTRPQKGGRVPLHFTQQPQHLFVMRWGGPWLGCIPEMETIPTQANPCKQRPGRGRKGKRR